MKNLVLQFIIMLVLLAGSIKAQSLIAVQNGGEPVFYQQVDSALFHSQDGDTIYIPGGTWYITQPVNKRLHLIGAGHNPDSTIATFQTTLIGNLSFSTGSSYGSFTGFYLIGYIQVLDATVVSCSISRCHIKYGINLYSSNDNFSFIENILEGGFWASVGPSSCTFFNNIIAACHWYSGDEPIMPFIDSFFKNNVFLDNMQAGGCQSIVSQYSLFENNIFIGYFFSNVYCFVFNSTFKNNLFSDWSPPPYPYSSNVCSNSINNQPLNSIFVNWSGTTFVYTDDYHLQSGCPGKNAGTDGTDMGIYGGSFPWKEGSVPFNPHIQLVNIADTTDQNGNLNVNIRVAAQDH